MRKTRSRRMIAVVLALLMAAGSLGIPGGGKVRASNPGWEIIKGSADELTTEEGNPGDVTFTNSVTAYYNQKIEVLEGTKISVDVSVPAYGAASAMLAYGFALVNQPGSFYTSDTAANWLQAELVSNANTKTVLGIARKRVAGTMKWLANLTPLSANRSSAEVYHITYEKINVTENDVNYSWKITMKSSSNTQSYMVPETEIAHDMFADGAYFAAGNRGGAATHTVKVANLTVVQPDEWGVIKGDPDQLIRDDENPADVTFTSDVTAYYNRKIDVQDGTKISVDVSVPTYGAASDLLDYAFALVDQSGSFNTSDTVTNSLMAELASQPNLTTVYGMARTKLSAKYTWLANLNPLSTKRSTKEVYHITYEKIDVTENDVNYSWKITMESSTHTQSYLVKATDIAQDLFKDGAYFAAGRRDGAATHTVKVANLTVTQPIATVLGDVNHDLDINVCDLVRLKKYMADNSVTIHWEAADCNEDGIVDEVDLAELRKIILRGKL